MNSRVAFGGAIVLLGIIGGWMALTGRLQKVWADATGQSAPAAPAPTAPLTPSGFGGRIDPKAGASGGWGDPTPPTSPTAGGTTKQISQAAVGSTVPVPDILPALTFIASLGTDGVKATPYVPPASAVAVAPASSIYTPPQNGMAP